MEFVYKTKRESSAYALINKSGASQISNLSKSKYGSPESATQYFYGKGKGEIKKVIVFKKATYIVLENRIENMSSEFTKVSKVGD